MKSLLVISLLLWSQLQAQSIDSDVERILRAWTFEAQPNAAPVAREAKKSATAVEEARLSPESGRPFYDEPAWPVAASSAGHGGRRLTGPAPYVYRGQELDAAAASEPLSSLSFFANVRAAFVPDFLCPADSFTRYLRSCPQDLTVLAYWHTGLIPDYALSWNASALVAVGLSGVDVGAVRPSDYFSCVDNCTLAFGGRLDSVPYGFSRFCTIDRTSDAWCGLEPATCPEGAVYNSSSWACECQAPLVYANYTSRTCRCPIGQRRVGATCEQIVCIAGERLVGDDCLTVCPPNAVWNNSLSTCVCDRSQLYISTPFNNSKLEGTWNMECVKQPDCPLNYYYHDPIECRCPFITAPDGVCAPASTCTLNGGNVTGGTCTWASYPAVSQRALDVAVLDWVTYGLPEDAGRVTYRYTLPTPPVTGARVRITVTATAQRMSDGAAVDAATVLTLPASTYDIEAGGSSTSIAVSPVLNAAITGDYLLTLTHTLSVAAGRDIRYSFLGNATPVGVVSFLLKDTSSARLVVSPAEWAQAGAASSVDTSASLERLELTVSSESISTYTVALGATWTTPEPYLYVAVRVAPTGGNASLVSVSPTWLVFAPQNTSKPVTLTVRWSSATQPTSTVFFNLIHTVTSSGSSSSPALFTGVASTVRGMTTSALPPALTLTPPAATRLTEGSSTTYSILLSNRAPRRDVLSIALSYSVIGNVTSELLAVINSALSLTPRTLRLSAAEIGLPQTIIVSYSADVTYTGNWSLRINHLVTTSDVLFSSISLPDVSLAMVDTDTPGLTLSQPSLSVLEGGIAEYTVTLRAKPLWPVTITVLPTVSSTLANVLSSVEPLTIQPSSWAAPRTVRLTAPDNAIASGDIRVTIDHMVLGYGVDVAVPSLAVTVVDNDQSAVNISVSTQAYLDGVTGTTIAANSGRLQVAEATDAVVQMTPKLKNGGIDYRSATFASVLRLGITTEPVQQVQLLVRAAPQVQLAVLNGSGYYVMQATRTLTFNASNWQTAQEVVVVAVDDALDEAASHGSSIDVSVVRPPGVPAVGASAAQWPDFVYGTVQPATIAVSVLDNDDSGLEVGYPYHFTGLPPAMWPLRWNPSWATLYSESANVSGIALGEKDLPLAPTASDYFPMRKWRPAVSTSSFVAVRLRSQPYDSTAAVSDPLSPPPATVNISVTTAYRMCVFSDGTFPETVLQCTADAQCDSLWNPSVRSIQSGACAAAAAVPRVSLLNASSWLTFDSSNWNMWQLLYVQARDDDVDNTGVSSDAYPSLVTLRAADVASSRGAADAQYAAATAAVNITIFDDDVSGVRLVSGGVSGGSAFLQLNEGQTHVYGLSLTSKPRAAVTITTFASGAAADSRLTFTPSMLVFTPDNWAAAQSLTVTAVQNYVDETTCATASQTAVAGGTAYTVFHDISASTTSTDQFYRALSRSQMPQLPLVLVNDDVAGVRLRLNTPTASLAAPSVVHLLVWLTSQPTTTVEVRVTAFAVGAPVPLFSIAADTRSNALFSAAGGDVLSSVTAAARDTVRLTFDAASWFTPQPALVLVPNWLAGNYSSVTFNTSLRFPSAIDAAYSVTQPPSMAAPLTSAAAVLTATSSLGLIRAEEGVSGTVGGVTAFLSGSLAGSTVSVFAYSGHCVSRGLPQFAIMCSSDADCGGGATCTSNTKVSVSPSSLDLTSVAAGEAVSRSLTVTALDDQLDEGAAHFAQVVLLTGGSTPGAAGATVISSASVLIVDNDGAGLQLSSVAANVTEGPRSTNTSSYTIRLRTPPIAAVTVTPRHTAGLLDVTVGASLVFTPENFATPQTVTVVVVDDAIRRSRSGQYAARVRHVLASTDPKYVGETSSASDFVCNVQDNDVAGLLIQVASASGAPSSLPAGGASVVVTEGAAATNLIMSLTSAPSTGSLLVRLSSAVAVLSQQPAGAVPTTVRQLLFVTDVAAAAALASSTGATVVAWNALTTIQLAVADDLVDRGTRTSTLRAELVSASDATATSFASEYTDVAATVVPLQIVDNDVAGVRVMLLSSATATNGTLLPSGSSSAYRVVEGESLPLSMSLTSRPADNTAVVLQASSSQGATLAIAVNGAPPADAVTLTFTPTNWNVSINVSLAAIDDTVALGDTTVTVSITLTARTTDTRYASMASSSNISMPVLVVDNDVKGVVVRPSAASGIAGRDRLTAIISLGAQPASPLSVTLAAPTNVTLSSSTVSLDATNWRSGVEVVLSIGAGTALAYRGAAWPLAITATPAAASGWAAGNASIRIFERTGASLSNTGSRSLSEGAETAIPLSLSLQPSADVSFTARIVKVGTTQSDVQIVDNATGTFSAATWPAPSSVRVRFTEDRFAGTGERVQVCTALTSVSPVYDGVELCSELALMDNDRAGFDISTVSGGNSTNGTLALVEGSTALLRVALVSVPRGTVTVSFGSDAPALLTFTPPQLSFLAGSSDAQTVTLRVTDDSALNPLRTGSLRISAAALSASGGATGGVDTAYDNLLVTMPYRVEDDDAARAAVTLDVSPSFAMGGMRVSEGSATTLFASLTVAPSVGMVVPVTFTPTPAHLFTVTPASFNFTSASPGPITLQLNATRDFLVNPAAVPRVSAIVAASTATTQPYAAKRVNMTVALDDVDVASLVLVNARWDGLLTLAEGANTAAAASYSLSLSAQPSADVTVVLSWYGMQSGASDAGLLVNVTAAGSSTQVGALSLAAGRTSRDAPANATISSGDPLLLTFTSINWRVGYVITVAAPADALIEGRLGYFLAHTVTGGSAVEYAGLGTQALAASVTDAGLVSNTSNIALAETRRRNATATYSLRLASPPSVRTIATLRVAAAVGSPTTAAGRSVTAGVSVSPSSIVFEAGSSAAAIVTVTLEDDDVAQGSRRLRVLHDIPSDSMELTLVISDDDVVGVTSTVLVRATAADARAGVDSALVVEGAAAAPVLQLRLTSQPSADVIFTFTESGASTGTNLLRTISALAVPAASWSLPFNVSIAAIRDNIARSSNGSTSITITASSADAAFSSPTLQLAAVRVVVAEADVARVRLSSEIRKQVMEGVAGSSDSFGVQLDSQPETGTVFLSVIPGPRLTANPSMLRFSASTWSEVQTVTVTPVNDAFAEDATHTDVVRLAIDTTTTADTAYRTLPVPSVSVSIIEDDVAGVAVSQSAVTVAESSAASGGVSTTASYSVTLTSAPYVAFGDSTTAPVTVVTVPWAGYCADRSSGQPNHTALCRVDADCASGQSCKDGAKITVSPPALTFTAGNWDVPQFFTVTAINDALVELPRHPALVAHAVRSDADRRYAAVTTTPSLSVTILDDDRAGVRLRYTNLNDQQVVYVNEDAAAPTATGRVGVSLSSQPWAAVTISPTVDASQLTLLKPASITITPELWDQPVYFTLAAVDDSIDESKPHISRIGYNVTSVDTVYAPLSINASNTAAIVASIMDNDYAGVEYAFRARVTSASGQRYLVRSLNVTGGADEATCTSLCADGPVGRCPLAQCAVLANVATDLYVAEGGITDSFNVRLTSQPTAAVTVVIPGARAELLGPVVSDTCGDGRTGVNGWQQQLATLNGGTSNNIAVLTFSPTNWRVPQAVSVVAVDDRVSEGGDQQLSLRTRTTSSDNNYQLTAAAATGVPVDSLRERSCAASAALGDATAHPGLAAAYALAATSTSLRSTPPSGTGSNGCPRGAIVPVTATVNEGAWAPAPAVSSVRFVDDLTGISIAFDVPVDLSTWPAAFPCTQLFTTATASAYAASPADTDRLCRATAMPAEMAATATLLGDGATCSWQSSTVAAVRFGPGATVVPGDRLVLLGNRVRASPIARLYSTGSASIAAPLAGASPSGALGSAETRVGQCVGFTVTVAQTGSGGRAMTYAWRLTAAKDATGASLSDYDTRSELASIRAALVASSTDTAAGRAGSDTLETASSDLPLGWTVTIAVTVTNFVGNSGSSSMRVYKSAVPVPTVLVPGVTTVLRSSPILVEARSFAPRCPGVPELTAEQRAMKFWWFDISNGFNELSELDTADNRLFEDDEVSTASAPFPLPATRFPLRTNFSRTLSLPAYTLAVDQDYTFLVIAAMASGLDAYATGTVTIKVQADDLSAVISGGKLVQAAARSALALDASGSSDPARLATTSNTQYTWSCSPNAARNKAAGLAAGTVTSCNVDLSSLFSPVATIPANTLVAGATYDFTVTYSVGTRSARYTQIVEVVSSLGPGFSLKQPAATLGRVSSTDRITLAASFPATQDRSGLVMQWSQDSGPALPLSAFFDTAVAPSYFATAPDADTLVFLPAVLNGDTEYSFCFTVRSTAAGSSGLSRGCVAFTTAPVPIGGALTVTALEDNTAFTPFKVQLSALGSAVDTLEFYYAPADALPAGAVRDGYTNRTPEFASWVASNLGRVGQRFDTRAPHDTLFTSNLLPAGELVVGTVAVNKYKASSTIVTTMKASPSSTSIADQLAASSAAAGDGDPLQSVSALASTASAARGTTGTGGRRMLAGAGEAAATAAGLLALARTAVSQATPPSTSTIVSDLLTALRGVTSLPLDAMNATNQGTALSILDSILKVAVAANVPVPLAGLATAAAIVADAPAPAVAATATALLTRIRGLVYQQLAMGAASSVAAGRTFAGLFVRGSPGTLDSVHTWMSTSAVATGAAGASDASVFAAFYASSTAFAGASRTSDPLVIQLLRTDTVPATSVATAARATSFLTAPVDLTLFSGSSSIAAGGTDAHPVPVPLSSGITLPVAAVTFTLPTGCSADSGARYDARFYNDSSQAWERGGVLAVAKPAAGGTCAGTVYSYHLSKLALVSAPNTRILVSFAANGSAVDGALPLIEAAGNPQSSWQLAVRLESAPSDTVTVAVSTPSGLCFDAAAGAFIRDGSGGSVVCDAVSSPCAAGTCLPVAATVSPTTLTFQPATFSTPQTVTVSAILDGYVEGSAAVSSSVSFVPSSADDRYDSVGRCVAADTTTGLCTQSSSNAGARIDLSIIDTDTVGFAFTDKHVLDGVIDESDGAQRSFAVSLRSRPLAPVTLTYASTAPAQLAAAGTLQFTSNNYNVPQRIVFAVVDDAIALGGNISVLIRYAVTTTDAGYAAAAALPAPDTVVIQDNDHAGVIITRLSAASMSESGGRITFSVSLASQPPAGTSVVVSLTGAITPPPAVPRSKLPFVFKVGAQQVSFLTFTDNLWQTPVLVTITGVSDGLKTGPTLIALTFGLSSNDPSYAALSGAGYDTNFTVTDADDALIVLTPPLPVILSGSSVQYSVRLNSQPAAAVTIRPVISNPNVFGGIPFPQPLSVEPAYVVIEPATFDQAQVFRIIASGADIAYPVLTFAVSHAVESEDTEYATGPGLKVFNVTLSQSALPVLSVEPGIITIREGAPGPDQLFDAALVPTGTGRSSFTAIRTPFTVTLLSQPLTPQYVRFAWLDSTMAGPIKLPGEGNLGWQPLSLDEGSWSGGVIGELRAEDDCTPWKSAVYVARATIVAGDVNYVGKHADFAVVYHDNDPASVRTEFQPGDEAAGLIVPRADTFRSLPVTLSLTAVPAAPVTVLLSSADPRLVFSPAAVEFPPSAFTCSGGVTQSPRFTVQLSQTPVADPLLPRSDAALEVLMSVVSSDPMFDGVYSILRVSATGDLQPTPSPTSTATTSYTASRTPSTTSSYGTSPSPTPSTSYIPTATSTWGSSASPSILPARSIVSLGLLGVPYNAVAASMSVQLLIRQAVARQLPAELDIKPLQIVVQGVRDMFPEGSSSGESGGDNQTVARRLQAPGGGNVTVGTILDLQIQVSSIGAAKALYAVFGDPSFEMALAADLRAADPAGLFTSLTVVVLSNAIVTDNPYRATEEPSTFLGGVAAGVAAAVLGALGSVAVYMTWSRAREDKQRRSGKGAKGSKLEKRPSGEILEVGEPTKPAASIASAGVDAAGTPMLIDQSSVSASASSNAEAGAVHSAREATPPPAPTSTPTPTPSLNVTGAGRRVLITGPRQLPLPPMPPARGGAAGAAATLDPAAALAAALRQRDIDRAAAEAAAAAAAAAAESGSNGDGSPRADAVIAVSPSKTPRHGATDVTPLPDTPAANEAADTSGSGAGGVLNGARALISGVLVPLARRVSQLASTAALSSLQIPALRLPPAPQSAHAQQQQPERTLAEAAAAAAAEVAAEAAASASTSASAPAATAWGDGFYTARSGAASSELDTDMDTQRSMMAGASASATEAEETVVRTVSGVVTEEEAEETLGAVEPVPAAAVAAAPLAEDKSRTDSADSNSSISSQLLPSAPTTATPPQHVFIPPVLKARRVSTLGTGAGVFANRRGSLVATAAAAAAAAVSAATDAPALPASPRAGSPSWLTARSTDSPTSTATGRVDRSRDSYMTPRTSAVESSTPIVAALTRLTTAAPPPEVPARALVRAASRATMRPAATGAAEEAVASPRLPATAARSQPTSPAQDTAAVASPAKARAPLAPAAPTPNNSPAAAAPAAISPATSPATATIATGATATGATSPATSSITAVSARKTAIQMQVQRRRASLIGAAPSLNTLDATQMTAQRSSTVAVATAVPAAAIASHPATVPVAVAVAAAAPVPPRTTVPPIISPSAALAMAQARYLGAPLSLSPFSSPAASGPAATGGRRVSSAASRRSSAVGVGPKQRRSSSTLHSGTEAGGSGSGSSTPVADRLMALSYRTREVAATLAQSQREVQALRANAEATHHVAQVAHVRMLSPPRSPGGILTATQSVGTPRTPRTPMTVTTAAAAVAAPAPTAPVPTAAARSAAPAAPAPAAPASAGSDTSPVTASGRGIIRKSAVTGGDVLEL